MLKRRILSAVVSLSLFFGSSFMPLPQAAASETSPTAANGYVSGASADNQNSWGEVNTKISDLAPYKEIIEYQTQAGLVNEGLLGRQVQLAQRSEPNGAGAVAEIAVPTVNPEQTNPEKANPQIASTTPVKSANVSRGQTTSRSQYVLTMVSTGYDGCYECNKPYYGKPAYTGIPLQRGVVAVDPRVIPMGTRLYVEGYGEAIAADQGNAIKGNRIDLFFDSHQQAQQWGIKTVKVTVLGK